MKVVEIFRSIEGEGFLMGLSTVFIRLFGCNMRCKWCDSAYTYEPIGKYNNMTIEQILQKAKDTSSSVITITGGEPFIHSELKALCDRLLKLNRTIKIETNGIIHQEIQKPIYLCVSPKPPDFLVDPIIADRADEMKFVIDEAIELSHILRYKKTARITLQIESNKNVSLEKALKLQDELLAYAIDTRVLGQFHKFVNLP
jgi:organic radical activating enzyme